MVSDIEIQDNISHQFKEYKHVRDAFFKELAIRQREMKQPTDWWHNYGRCTPDLRRIALRILGLTCTSTCERNWSTFEHVSFKNDSSNDLVHEGCDLTWIQVDEALGASKILEGSNRPRRSGHGRRNASEGPEGPNRGRCSHGRCEFGRQDKGKSVIQEEEDSMWDKDMEDNEDEEEDIDVEDDHDDDGDSDEDEDENVDYGANDVGGSYFLDTLIN
ncbi:PREDICTED: pheromone-processing carboxypeptidase KEX1-like [Nelumbo nucifera]|uniref:Pheromone-processing carboxypeptidase KEX1-like n=1 Tax=Nelumbo nucifera TaxID=4432 RepID=A0A1U8B7P2_NELNU|nr:PREDICTED: pheromone-processing carboxypeptidase KEX1-like [Nelumbo nucifera]